MLFAARDEEAAILGALACAGVLLLGVLVLVIFYYITLMRALQAVSPRNRTMEPGLVWLNFVPCLNIVWQFITVIRIGDSLRNEYQDRGMRSNDESYGKTIGIIMCVLNLLGGFVNVGARGLTDEMRGEKEVALLVGGVFLLLGLVQLILWIVYWVKIAGFTRELNSTSQRSRYDDDDDRPRRRYDDDYDRGGRDDRDRGGYDDRDRGGRDEPRGRDDRGGYDDDYRPRRDD